MVQHYVVDFNSQELHMRTTSWAFLLSQTLTLSSAFAQETLPPKMEGKWHNPGSGHSNTVEVELLKMESPTRAVIKIAWWPYCRTSESLAEFKDGAWLLTAKRCQIPGGDTEITAQVRPVDGKKRLEGVYGPGNGRTVYLEWP